MKSEDDDAFGDDALDRALAEYLSRLDRGETVDREQLLNDHPELADQLCELLDTVSLVEGMAGPVLAESELVGDDTLARTARFDADTGESTTGPPSDDEPAHRMPRLFGDYELLEEIGRGGMGVVYKARQVNLDRLVAVKMILTGRLATDEEQQRFYAEARAAGRLSHPRRIRGQIRRRHHLRGSS